MIYMFIYIHKALLLPTSMCQTPSKRRTDGRIRPSVS